MKKIFALLILSIILLSSINVSADYLYTDSYKTKVSSGITYEKKNILTENDWIKAHIACIDLTDDNPYLKVMTSQEGSSYLSTVSQMAKENDATISINADFFNLSSGQTNMLGMAYKDGELISTPALDNQVSLVLTEENEILMDYFSFEANLTSPQGYVCPIYQINKVPVTTGGITILTSAFAKNTWGGESLIEVLVENDVVKEIYEPGQGAQPMPDGCYVLVTNPEINGFLSNFSIGNEVKIDFKLTPDITNIKEATGGNTLLVDEGKQASFTSNVSGNAQRSAIGITEDKKKLIILATEGREANCKGLNQSQLAELMISLGAYRAINLDGGGSTTFVKKDFSGNQEIMNNVSSPRKVSTAIGIFEKNIKGTRAATGELSAERDILLVGDTVSLSAMFYDEKDAPFFPAPSDVKFYDYANQNIQNGIYSPKKAGTHTVYAKYKDITLNTQIKAVDDIFALEIEDKDYNLSSGSLDLTVYGYSAEGKRFKINPALLDWSSDNDNVRVESGKVTVKDNNGAVIMAKFKNKTDYIIINKENYGNKAPLPENDVDSFYGTINNSKTIAISGDIPFGKTMLDTFFSYKRFDNLSSHELSFITSSYYDSSALKNTLIADKFNVKTIDSTSFITLGSSKEIIPASNLASLLKALETSSKNIVVILKSSPDLLGYDGEILKEFLSEKSKSGKNVFCVFSNDNTRTKVENGVRYISAGAVSDFGINSYKEDAKYCPYVMFSVSGNEIKYEFINDKIR